MSNNNKVTTVLRKQKFSWFTIMPMLKEAVDSGESGGYFEHEGDVHKINVKEQDKFLYKVTINNITIGEAIDMGDMWELIEPTVRGV